ncbi:MAG: PH domain-containing protein [Phycisphaerales bacterium]
MTQLTENASRRIYGELWSMLVAWFRVPGSPPTLPVREGDHIESFRPAEAWLRYLKLWFWIGLLPLDIAIAVGWIALMFARPWLGVLLFAPALIVAVVPDVLVYIGLHLRYDTTWYVMTDRSLRIRTGIWTIREMTITFENVQNVSVSSGPVQRAFGIADVVVETAGGGSPSAKGAQSLSHAARIEGIADAERIRSTILARVKASRSAGLGDDPLHGRTAFTAEHVEALREIRDLLTRAA